MTEVSVSPLKTNRESLSTRAHQYLLGLIDDGTFVPGEQLPSQNDLAAQLGISRATLREALLNLEQKGIVIRRQGVGTFVAPGYEHRLASGLECLESILESAARQGMRLECADLDVKAQPADAEQAASLQVNLGVLLTSVARVLKADGRLVSYMLDLVPSSLLPVEQIGVSFNGSVLDSLRHGLGVPITQAAANIAAVNANGELAEKLRVERRQALLLMEETLYNETGQVVGFSRNYFVPDFFQFHLVRR